MKKVEILFDFYDKFHTSSLFKAGDVVEFDDERAADVVARGLAKAVKTKGKAEKTPDPVKVTDTTDPEKDNTPETETEGQANTKEEVKDGVKTETETEEEKKVASEKKAAEILAKVNKK